MDTTKIERHAEQFGALGHPARLSLLRLVVQAGAEGISTTELQGKLDLPWTTLNHHLSRLVSAGLVNAERDGKFSIHTADYAELKALTAFLWEDCCKSGKRPKGCC
jgi:DNA-binding transcriptional ArsR family regulator